MLKMSDKEPKKEAIFNYLRSTLKTFVIVLIISVILAGIIILLENNNKQEDIKNSNKGETYDVGVDGIQLKMPDDIAILSDEQITNYLGEEYLSNYDCIALSDNYQKIIMVFSDDKSDSNYTAEEYLKDAMQDEDLEITKQEINGRTFYLVAVSYTENDVEYINVSCVYDAGDQFICMLFESPADDELEILSIIS